MSELLNSEKLAKDAVDMANSYCEDYENLIHLGVIRGPILGIVNLCERNDKYKWHVIEVPDDDTEIFILMEETISWAENSLSNVVIISGKVGLKQYESN